jgi:chromosome segregation ATPase
MPKFTKAELQKLLEDTADDGSISLFNQDELNDILKTRLAKEADKITAASTEASQLKAQLEKTQAELQAVKEQANGNTKTAQQQLEAELEKKNQAIQAWEKQLSEAEQKRQTLETKYFTEHQSRTLQGFLAKAGAAKEGLEHAAFICGVELDGTVQTVAGDNGKPVTKAIDPLRQNEVDLGEVVTGWLEKNPHFKAASPSGPGVTGAGPQDPQPKPPPHITEGRTPREAMRAAVAEQAGRKPRSPG